MKLSNVTVCAAFAAAAFAAAPVAEAQVRLGVGVNTDVNVGVGVRVGEPYTYRGYHSGRWYPYESPRRSGRWHADYGGYDCYRAFMYTWDDDRRSRYESYWCFDERGRDYEVRRTRVAVSID